MAGTLDKDRRDAIVRMAEEGYTNKEIQDTLGVTPPTVRKYAGPARARGTVKSRQVLQAEVDDLKREVQYLKEIVAELVPLSKLPLEDSEGHPLRLILKCTNLHHQDESEYWFDTNTGDLIGPITGSEMATKKLRLEIDNQPSSSDTEDMQEHY